MTSPRSTRVHRVARLLKRTVFVLTLVLIVAALYVTIASERRLSRDYAIDVQVTAPEVSLVAEGAHLARSRGCMDCHGADLGGKLIADAMPFGRLVGDNLTHMPDTTPTRVHERMLRALRHGVDMQSKPLLMMPSKEFANLSAREIEAIAAYAVATPRVTRAVPDSVLGPLGRTLLAVGKLEGFLSAEVIDHDAPILAAAPPIGTLAHGRHLALLCTGCHREDFGGGPMDHGPPNAPPAANLTAHASGLGTWSEADFIASVRTGVRPDGTRIDGTAMPLGAVGAASDAELKSIYAYLRSVPPVARDVRVATAR